MSRKCIPAILLLSVLLLYSNASGAEVIAEFTTAGDLAFASRSFGKDGFLARAFEITSNSTVTEIQLYLKQGLCESGNVILQLRRDSSGLPSSQTEAEIQLSVSEVPEDEPNWVSFIWPQGQEPNLSPGKWWISCKLSSNANGYANPTIHWLGNNTAEGNPYGPWDDNKGTDGVNWWTPLTDLVFRVFGERDIEATTTSVTANPANVADSGVSTIEVSVRKVSDSSLVPCTGEVILSSPDGGTLGDTTIELAAGIGSTTWTGPHTPGIFNINASYQGQSCGGTDYTASDANTNINVESGYYDTNTIQILSSNNMIASHTIPITVNVLDEYGDPVDGGRVTFSCIKGYFSGRNPRSCPVSSGLAETEWTAPSEEDSFTIKADYSGYTIGATEYRSSDDEDLVTVGFIDANTVTTVRVSPDHPYVGKSAYVIVEVKDADTGLRVPSGQVELSEDTPNGTGWFQNFTINVQNGRAHTIWYAPGEDYPGTYTFIAEYIEDGINNISDGVRYHASEANTTATVVVDDDGVNLTFLSEWIAAYPRNPVPSGVISQRFSDVIEAELGWGLTEWSNDLVYEIDMKSSEVGNGAEDSYLDSHDLTWYNGHGNADYITFITEYDDKRLYHSDADDSWGDIDAEWVTFLSCKVLSHADDWAKTMKGLHLICGFHTNAVAIRNFGSLFASFMIKENLFDEPHTIAQSWFLAGDQGQPNWVRQCVVGETASMFDDYIWSQGKIGTDPALDDDDVTLLHNVDNNDPEPNHGGPYTATVGVPKQFDGSGTFDPDTYPGSTFWLAWDFDTTFNSESNDWDGDGDGNEVDDDADDWGVNPTWTWGAAGSYEIRLIVHDDTWNIADACTTVLVNNPPPITTLEDVIIENQSESGIEIVNNFPNLPTESELPVFRTSQSDTGYAEMMNVASYWSMTRRRVGLDTVGNWNMVDGDHELIINPQTDSVMYLNRQRAYIFSSDIFIWPPSLPDPCYAHSLAEQFMLDNDIIVDPHELVFEGISDITAEQRAKGSHSPPAGIPFNRRINFGRKLIVEGDMEPDVPYPVVGPGGKIILMIDEYEHVIMYVKIWREVEPTDDIELYPASMAISDFHLLGLKALIKNSYVPPCNRININNVSLGYYEEDFVTAQDNIYPVYILDLTCEDEKSIQHAQVYMSALAPPIEATIDEPNTGTEIDYNQPITFSADANGGTSPYTYHWESDVDGLLSSEPNFTTTLLSVKRRARDCSCQVAPHTISLTVTDANGFAASESVKVTVQGLCADFYRDGIINLKDFALFASCWLAEPSPQECYQQIELNGDALVDMKELCILADEWLQTSI